MDADPYLAALSSIPAGRTSTFAELARLAGRPTAARAAGRAIASCPIDAPVPWHRIVASDGSLAADPWRAAAQAERLRLEGARPRADESVAAWAQRVGAGWVGRWRGKRYARASDARIETWPALEVEAIFDETIARQRGFVDLDAVRASAAAPATRSADAVEQDARSPIAARLTDLDWSRTLAELAMRGVATVPALLEPGECRVLRRSFGEAARFERTIEMAPRGYGIGSYGYFREPLPEPASTLRAVLYEKLRDLAARAPAAVDYPPSLAEFWKRCRAHGQRRASSILLHYREGGINHLHRDIYGRQWFPYQALVVLSTRAHEFEGGEFVLAEKQSDGARIERELPLDQGDLCVFGSRGYGARAPGERWVELDHGMRAVTRGERFALGIVFHLAE